MVSLFKLFAIMLVEELLGEIICVRGSLILSDNVLTLVRGLISLVNSKGF